MNAMASTPNGESDRSAIIQQQESSLDRQLEWIRAVDSKTPIIIGLATAMLAVTGALSPDPKSLTWATGVLMAIGSLPLIGSLCWCAAATFPHTEGPDGSLIYFGGISKRSSAKYTEAVSTRTTEDYLQDLNAQCHRNAQIATAKYRAVQRAHLWLFIATPVWLIACYLLYKG